MQHKIQRMQVGQFISLHIAAADSGEMFLHSLRRYFADQNGIILRLKRDEANVGVITFVARAGMRDLSQLNFHCDHGGTTPVMRAYATSCPMCSLAWIIMRRYIPSTVASRSAICTLRCKSAGFSATCAALTASRDRFSHLMTSAFDVTVFSASSFKSSGILGPVTLSR